MNHLPLAAAATLAAALSSGCQTHPIASQPSHPGDVERVALPEVTWAFDYHSFGAYCYNTIGCKVLYANRYQGISYDDDEQAEPMEQPGIQAYWGGMHVGIDNFPPPALVTWRSLDGVAHAINVDIGAIFKEQHVLHDVPAEMLAWNATRTGLSPSVILVVDDRTVSVYMKAFVVLKDLQVPGNTYSDVRDEPVLAYRRTY